MKSNEKNEVTLDELAAMVARGFDGLNTKIETEISSVRKDLHEEISFVRKELHEEISSVKVELRSFRREFNDFRSEVRSEFKTLWREVDNINNRLDRIEKNKAEELELITGDLLTIKSKVANLEQKVNKFKLAS